jgi:hypothetical protein
LLVESLFRFTSPEQKNDILKNNQVPEESTENDKNKVSDEEKKIFYDKQRIYQYRQDFQTDDEIGLRLGIDP